MTIGLLLCRGRQAFPPTWVDDTGRPQPSGLYGTLVAVSSGADRQSLILVNHVDGRELRGVLEIDDAARLPAVSTVLMAHRGRPITEVFFAEDARV